ncbi:hypothetical protein SISNIDRAFT_247387 [Sistotremastrum niveocremeum HHB9708]|uniref:Uncharacterized protein n=1 Tax=Sistotremastrum niveocremeum HHB9708 TaxID=1314777 RepID=A0A164YS86_9AGAM|nr:hypothetical protein SISNIDRAFT_247387 [Sistotremastrum niveocremeum HHB9708]
MDWKTHYGNLRFLSLDSMRGFRFHRNALVQLESLEILEIFISDSCHLLRAEQFPPSMHTLVIRFSTRRPAPYETLEILGSLSKFIDDVATPHCSIKRIDLSWPFAGHRTDLGMLSLLCSCLKEKCRRRGIKLQIESVPAGEYRFSEAECVLKFPPAWSPPVLEFNYQSKYDRWARPQGRILRMADAALRKIRR